MAMKAGRKNMKKAYDEDNLSLQEGQSIMQVVSLRGSNLIEVFLFANSKCKRYFQNRLKPAKLCWTAMYMKQHKKLAGKFNLDANSELQITVHSPTPGSLTQVDFQVTNKSNALVLHWGAICQTKKDWTLPSRRPDGTRVHKNRALRTPFAKSGLNSSLIIEIDDPEIHLIEFLIVDETQNKWFKHNGQNFQVHLLGKDHQSLSGPIPKNLNVSPPEDLVQIQAFLRWEINGRQAYTPEKEKEEYEAARAELLEAICRGASIEEHRTKLTKGPSDAQEDNVKTSSVEVEIPDDLVQVQAFIRWEKAGKPNYSPEKQLVMLYSPCTFDLFTAPTANSRDMNSYHGRKSGLMLLFADGDVSG